MNKSYIVGKSGAEYRVLENYWSVNWRVQEVFCVVHDVQCLRTVTR
jgi:hypothetical protein